MKQVWEDISVKLTADLEKITLDGFAETQTMPGFHSQSSGVGNLGSAMNILSSRSNRNGSAASMEELISTNPFLKLTRFRQIK